MTSFLNQTVAVAFSNAIATAARDQISICVINYLNDVTLHIQRIRVLSKKNVYKQVILKINK